MDPKLHFEQSVNNWFKRLFSGDIGGEIVQEIYNSYTQFGWDLRLSKGGDWEMPHPENYKLSPFLKDGSVVLVNVIEQLVVNYEANKPLPVYKFPVDHDPGLPDDQPEEKADEETPIILSGASPKKAKPAVSPPKPMTTNGQEIQMAIKTFRHSDWQGGGEDNFDEEVSRFLVGVGTGNVVSVTPISYTDGDAKLDDYGWRNGCLQTRA